MMMQSYELRPGLQEMWEVLQVLKERGQKSSGKFTPKFAAADRDLWHCFLGSQGSSRECRVRSLSPSDASILAAKIDLASEFVPGYLAPKRCLPSPSPNHTAVVIWIDVGKFSILLGSDLQETGDANSGWSAIILSDSRPTSKASFFKIPHHGSKNGYHPMVWKDMLEPKPISVLTPFELGNRRVPTKTDVRRLISLSDESYSTASFGRKLKKKRERMVEKTLQEVGITVTQKHDGFGHVRVRIDPAMQVRTELFGEALPLNMIYAA